MSQIGSVCPGEIFLPRSCPDPTAVVSQASLGLGDTFSDFAVSDALDSSGALQASVESPRFGLICYCLLG